MYKLLSTQLRIEVKNKVRLRVRLISVINIKTSTMEETSVLQRTLHIS